jgi:DNA-binding winged helix-turn-helix (wHTH) protein/TolB-like protein
MTYRFGDFRYDSAQRVLYRGEELVPLVPKALDTLQILLERRGTVVEKSELMKLVWPDTTVEEVGLPRNISLLRKALGDDSEDHPFIETIPRRGYRFAAEVTTEEAATPPPDQLRGRGPRWFLGLAVAALLGAAVYYQFYVPSRYFAIGAGSAAMAVVPFDCLCDGMDGDAFSRGLDEVLVADLSKLKHVQVVAPSTVRRHRHAGVSMGLMGRLLGLDALLEGTVQRLGEHLRVTARLVDVHTGRVIWAETYDEPARDLGAAQEAVGRAVAAEVGKRLVR